MKKLFLAGILLCFCKISIAQDQITYTLTHEPGSSILQIEIEFKPLPGPSVKLIIPRSGPGTYSLTNYLAFITNPVGLTVSGNEVAGKVGDGSYFEFNGTDESLNQVSYLVDIKKMEKSLLDGSASSKTRENYLGMLGYSVFGFVEGLETKPIQLAIETGSDWPIFTTLRPTLERKLGSDQYAVENFAALADGQYLLGSAVQVHQVTEAPLPLFVAAYAETAIDIVEIGRRGMVALNGLNQYFGYTPMPHYTMFYEFLNPISDRHDYGFNMEHLNSMSSTNEVSRAITKYEPNARIGTIVHHIGHSWVPLRSYGTGYKPFEWQTAPLIETIWLNEGFTWYISFYNILEFEAILKRFETTMDTAPDYIKAKSLRELSLLGSTQYALDFRIGQNLFSRGALLAHDLDLLILKETNGEKSFKDAVLGLLSWTEENKRAFTYEEIEPIMSKATGVNLSIVWENWQNPIK